MILTSYISGCFWGKKSGKNGENMRKLCDEVAFEEQKSKKYENVQILFNIMRYHANRIICPPLTSLGIRSFILFWSWKTKQLKHGWFKTVGACFNIERYGLDPSSPGMPDPSASAPPVRSVPRSQIGTAPATGRRPPSKPGSLASLLGAPREIWINTFSHLRFLPAQVSFGFINSTGALISAESAGVHLWEGEWVCREACINVKKYWHNSHISQWHTHKWF